MEAYEERDRRHLQRAGAVVQVIPADKKWFMRMAVAEIVVDTMEGMDLSFPVLSEEKRNELRAPRGRSWRTSRG